MIPEMNSENVEELLEFRFRWPGNPDFIYIMELF